MESLFLILLQIKKKRRKTKKEIKAGVLIHSSLFTQKFKNHNNDIATKVTTSDVYFGEGISAGVSITYTLGQNVPYFIYADSSVLGWVISRSASRNTAYFGWLRNPDNSISITSSKGNVITVTNNVEYTSYVGFFRLREK